MNARVSEPRSKSSFTYFGMLTEPFSRIYNIADSQFLLFLKPENKDATAETKTRAVRALASPLRPPKRKTKTARSLGLPHGRDARSE